MATWAMLFSDLNPLFSAPFAPIRADFPQGGMVLNEWVERGAVTDVTLLNRYDDSYAPVVVEIDSSDLSTMDNATKKYWQYSSPGNFPRGVYLPCAKKHQVLSLVRLLLNPPAGVWRLFKDGDPLNCKRANIAFLPRPPFQSDWLWNAPLPRGFTELRRSENYIMVKAAPGADNRLMWQYLLERWQFCRAKGICITAPRIHESRTSWTQRMTAIVCRHSQTYSFDIGDDGARENCQYDVRETMREAA